MTSRKNCLSLIGGVASFLLVLTPNAFAKHSSTGGQARGAMWGRNDHQFPITLWPPNHKLKTINISFAESEVTPDDDTLGTTDNRHQLQPGYRGLQPVASDAARIGTQATIGSSVTCRSRGHLVTTLTR